MGMVACAVVLIISNFVVWKYKTQEPEVPAPANPFNNQAHNPKIISLKGSAIVVFMILFSAISNYILFLNDVSIDSFLYRNIQFQVLAMLIAPTLNYFFFNDKLKEFLKQTFWEFAPEFLQQYNPDLVVPFEG